MRVNFNPNFIIKTYQAKSSLNNAPKVAYPMQSSDSFTFRGKGYREDDIDIEEYPHLNMVQYEAQERTPYENLAIITAEDLENDEKVEPESETEKTEKTGNKDVSLDSVSLMAFIYFVVLYLLVANAKSETRSVGYDVRSLGYDMRAMERSLKSNDKYIADDMEDMQEDIDSLESKIDKLIELEEKRQDIEAQIMSLPSDDEKAEALKEKLAELQKELEEYVLENE